MGVEPTTSRVRFQSGARRSTDTTRKLSQIKTHVAEGSRMSGVNRHTTAPVLGQKADSVGVKSSVAPLIANLEVCSNPLLRENFSTAVREVSVSFKRGDGNESESNYERVYPFALCSEGN
jgi:hypothetical protein